MEKVTQFQNIAFADSDDVTSGVNAFLWHVMQNPTCCVWAINPFRLNDRLTAQRGLFLCPGDTRIGFEENMEKGHPSPCNLVRFVLSTDRKARECMLKGLHETNNNYASLFPGLAGFARSLHQKVWLDLLRPEKAGHASLH
jgi:hypothetical protein